MGFNFFTSIVEFISTIIQFILSFFVERKGKEGITVVYKRRITVKQTIKRIYVGKSSTRKR